MFAKQADIESLLEALTAQIAECRAAAATAADGDPSALAALSDEVDAMAAAVARLKALVSAPAL